MEKTKKILLLNAGHTEIPLIEELKKMGVYLITSGKRGDLPGHKMGDEYIEADYSDKEKILELVKREGVDGIISCAHDYGLITASYVAEKMGWKGHDTYENTLRLHQKDLFKELCEQLDIRSPRSYAFTEPEKAEEFAKSAEYPIIVKAVDQASGVGVMRADNYDEAVRAISNGFANSRGKRIVIEPFIVGAQESFVAFVVDKKVVSSMSCNCYSPINPYLIQTETMPSDNYENLKEELTGIIEKLFHTLNLVDGIITLQYIVKDGKPYIIETMRRCLGNQFLTAISAVTGFPWHKALVLAELGESCKGLPQEEPEARFSGHHAIMSSCNGIYMGTTIPSDIMDHVYKYVELFEKGQRIDNYKNERIGYIYYTYETREELDNAAKSFNQRIRINVIPE